MAPQAATPSLPSKRSRAGESSVRRTAVAARATRQASASGLRAIQVSSAAGKAASAAGCAQNEETESVHAQENAATPPGKELVAPAGDRRCPASRSRSACRRRS